MLKKANIAGNQSGRQGGLAGYFRSRIFWLGLFPLIFIAWAWRDSHDAMSFASGHSNHGYLMVGQTNGAVLIAHGSGFNPFDDADYSAGREPDSGIQRESKVRILGGWKFPVAFETGLVGEGPSTARFSFFAWWAIASIHLTAWFAINWWWQRRMRTKPRLNPNGDSPDPETS